MKGRAEVRGLLYRVLASMYRYAEKVEVIEYPRNEDRRSIDLAVVLRNKNKLLVKVALDLSKLPKNEIAELTAVALTFRVPAIVTALYNKEKPLIEGVAYSRMNLMAVDPNTLESVLSGQGKLYVYSSKDTFRVKVNPEKLRERRNSMNMSLGHVASYLGVSREAVYRYERGLMDPTIDKAEKLVELFGEDILEEIDIFKPPKTMQGAGSKPSTTDEIQLANKLATMGLRVVHTKRTATDIVAASDEVKIAAIVERRRESASKLLERAEYATRLAQAIDANMIALTRNSEVATELEALGFESVKEPQEARDLVRRNLLRNE
ncbi:helix-turn-helix domain-containing protein [Stetteria hydrogenophila]